MENNIQKQHYKNSSIVTFMIAAISFVAYIYTSSQATGGSWWNMGIYPGLALISLGITFIATIISIFFFFEYKKNKGIFIYRDVSAKVTIGIVVIVLVFLWHFIIGMKISIVEYILFGIGIFLILAGIFQKPKK